MENAHKNPYVPGAVKSSARGEIRNGEPLPGEGAARGERIRAGEPRRPPVAKS
ncbi:MAG: hypothetical protein GY859_39685 [Desulfobacterales bacterium]|nr:hypothetical protein [Desulfobacterales bacterium]